MFFGIFHHEPWRDEAHVWRAARDNTIEGIIGDIRYEGTPTLWTLVLVPFAKAGMPYPITMQLVHAAFAISAVGLLLFYSKIQPFTKIAFIFSYYMAYEYAVVARHYVLTTFLLFSIAAIYSKRFKTPIVYAVLVTLLLQTNAYSIVPAGALIVLFGVQTYIDRKVSRRTIIALFIMIAGALFTVISLFPDRSVPYNPLPPQNPVHEIQNVILESIAPSSIHMPLEFIELHRLRIKIVSAVCLLSFVFMVLFSRKAQLIFLSLAMISWIFVMNILIHAGGLRHHGLILIFLMFLYWLYEVHRKEESVFGKVMRRVFMVSLSGLLALSILFTVYIYDSEYRYEFSGGKDMAGYIKSHNLESMRTAAFPGTVGESVLAYFKDKKYWNPEFASYGYRNVADFRYQPLLQKMNTEEALRFIRGSFSDGKPYLLLLYYPLSHEELDGYTLVHVSHSNFGPLESIWLYSMARPENNVPAAQEDHAP